MRLNGRDHGRDEANLITLGAAILCAIVIVGIIFPLVESLMTWVVVSAVTLAIALLAIREWRAASGMWHALHDPIEKLKQEDEEFGLPPTILKRNYGLDD